jgi:uncharacterized protein (TIGR02271 family)
MNKRSNERQRRKPAVEQCEQVESEVIPVVEEHLKVGKREIESGRVIVTVAPEVHKKVIDLPVMEQTALIERVPVNRIVEKIEAPRQEGDVTVVPIYEEVLVVEKRLVLKEEIRVSRERRTRQDKREVELRSEKVEARREPPKGHVN